MPILISTFEYIQKGKIMETTIYKKETKATGLQLLKKLGVLALIVTLVFYYAITLNFIIS